MLTRTTLAIAVLIIPVTSIAQQMPRSIAIGGSSQTSNPRVRIPQTVGSSNRLQKPSKQEQVWDKQQRILGAVSAAASVLQDLRHSSLNSSSRSPVALSTGPQRQPMPHSWRVPISHRPVRVVGGKWGKSYVSVIPKKIKPVVVSVPPVIKPTPPINTAWEIPIALRCPPANNPIPKTPKQLVTIVKTPVKQKTICVTKKIVPKIAPTIVNEPEELDGLFDEDCPLPVVAPSNSDLVSTYFTSLATTGPNTCDRLAIIEVQEINRLLIESACDIARAYVDEEGSIWALELEAGLKGNREEKLSFLSKHGAKLLKCKNGQAIATVLKLSCKLDKFVSLIDSHNLDGTLLAKHGKKLLVKVERLFTEASVLHDIECSPQIVVCVKKIIGLGNIKSIVCRYALVYASDSPFKTVAFSSSAASATDNSACQFVTLIAELNEAITCAKLEPCTLSLLVGAPIYTCDPTLGLDSSSVVGSAWITNPIETGCEVRYLIDGANDNRLASGYVAIHEGATQVSFDDGTGRQVDYVLRDARYQWELDGRQWDLKKLPAKVVIDNTDMPLPLHVLVDGEAHTIAAGETIEFKADKPIAFTYDNGGEIADVTLDTGSYRFGVDAATGKLNMFDQDAVIAALPEPEEAA